MKSQTYKHYKHSGKAWLEELPAHWEVKRLKQILVRNDGGVWGDDPKEDGQDTVVLRSTEQTADGRWILEDPALRALSFAEKSSALLKEGDLVVTKSSGSALHIGKTSIVTKEIESLSCCYSNFMQRLRVSSEINPKLVWYMLNNKCVREQFDFLSNSTTGLANLGGGLIGEAWIPFAPPKEQEAMVAFLDCETVKIDTLIAEQRALIEQLREKRVAVTNHLVTKGLDPGASMRDSGIEWIGSIPAHWQVHRNAVLFRERTEPGIEGLPILSISLHTGVSDEELKEGDDGRLKRRIEDRSAYSRVYIGDLAYNMMRAWQGGLGSVAADGLISPAYVVLCPKPGVLSEYFEALFRTPCYMRDIERYSKGITSFRWRLYWEDFKQLRSLVPPEDEQRMILEAIRQELTKIDPLEAEAEITITLLQEHRSALITAVVTGKVDVRGAVA